MNNLGAYQPGMDIEARTIIDMLDTGRFGKMSKDEEAALIAKVSDRLAMISAGARRAPDHWNRRLHDIDANLRIRWDYEKPCWAVERWVWQERSWVPLKYWMDDTGALLMDIPWLCHILVKGDMWNNANHWQERRDEAAIIRQGHDKRSTDRVLDAVDKLSTKRMREFIRVEQALHTGERFISHGSDLKFLERQAAASKSSPALPGSEHCINPGAHPRILKRNYRRRINGYATLQP